VGGLPGSLEPIVLGGGDSAGKLEQLRLGAKSTGQVRASPRLGVYLLRVVAALLRAVAAPLDEGPPIVAPAVMTPTRMAVPMVSR
jgi:hypothetical protein